MTHEEAYIQGFCKAAEAVGVDPIQLYKIAGIKDRIAGLGGQALGGLLRAGNAVSGAAKATGTAASGVGRRYLELLRGGRPRFIETMRQGLGLEKLPGLPEVTNPAQRIKNRIIAAVKDRASRIKGGPGENPADVVEARKALATQLGTGAAVTAAGVGTGAALARDKK